MKDYVTYDQVVKAVGLAVLGEQHDDIQWHAGLTHEQLGDVILLAQREAHAFSKRLAKVGFETRSELRHMQLERWAFLPHFPISPEKVKKDRHLMISGALPKFGPILQQQLRFFSFPWLVFHQQLALWENSI